MKTKFGRIEELYWIWEQMDVLGHLKMILVIYYSNWDMLEMIFREFYILLKRLENQIKKNGWKGYDHWMSDDIAINLFLTCHHAEPGIVNWKKFRALQTIERVFPGAIGTLNEQIQITHFWSPNKGSFVSISILKVKT